MGVLEYRADTKDLQQQIDQIQVELHSIRDLLERLLRKVERFQVSNPTQGESRWFTKDIPVGKG